MGPCCDLAEIFKPLLADRLLFKLINNRQISERDFSQDLNGCYLKESGRKVVLKEWDARLETTIEHRRLHRKVSYERLIRLECYKLVKHLTNAEPYVAFRAWWRAPPDSTHPRTKRRRMRTLSRPPTSSAPFSRATRAIVRGKQAPWAP